MSIRQQVMQSRSAQPSSEIVQVSNQPSGGLQTPGINDQSISIMSAFWDLASRIALTDFAGSMKGKPESVFAAMMKGHEVGLQPMQALDSIDVIQGKPTLKPEVMRALIRQHGHDFHIEEMASDRCVIKAHRREWAPDKWTTFEFTIQDAKDMQLTGKDNWKKQPKVMLLARCTSMMGRAEFADVLKGLSYTPDEILDSIETSSTVRTIEPIQVNEPEFVTVNMLPELEVLTVEQKKEIKDWWADAMPQADMPQGCKADAVPEHRVQEVRNKIKQVIESRALLNSHSHTDLQADDGPILEGEQVGSTTPGDKSSVQFAAAGNGVDEPPASSVDVLKAIFTERSIRGPLRWETIAEHTGADVSNWNEVTEDIARKAVAALDN